MKTLYLLFLSLFTYLSTFAVTKTWIGASGGTWSVPANWDAGVPTSVEDVIINTSGTIIIDGVKTVNSLTITAGTNVIFTGNSTTTSITLGCAGCASLIDLGGTLTLTGTTALNKCELIMSNAAIFNVNGTLNLGIATQTSTQRLLPAAGTVININGAINIVGSGASVSGSAAATYVVNGVQEMKRNGGIFPTGTYATTARNIISGQTTSQVSFTSSQLTTWGNIEFNAPGNTLVATNNLFSGNAICESLKIIDDGSGNAALSGSSTSRIITINRNLEIGTGTNLSINVSPTVAATGSGLVVLGNTVIDGNLTETGSNTASFLTLGSTSAQTISINGTISNDVTLNINGAGLKTALTDIVLPNSANAKLVFTNGNLDMLTNNKLLFIQNNVTTACISGTAGSHVIGKMKRNTNFIGAYHFPVSNNTTDIPKCLITTEVVGASDFTVEFLGSNANKLNGLSAGVIDQVGNYVWDIQRSVGGSTAQISLGYGGYAANNIASPTQAKVVHWNGSIWENKGGTVDVVPASINAITSNIGCNDFSPYSIGGIIGTLPVSIEFFKGTKQATGNNLDWKVTCTSSPSVILTLERSADGANFKMISEQNATATRCLQDFNYVDASPLAGKNFYRLKITSVDGAFRYSSVVVLLNKEKGFELISVAPNPVRDFTALTLTTVKAGKMDLSVSDITGKIVAKQTVTVIAGNNLIDMNFATLGAGTYMITAINADGEVKTTRFVKY
jgi:Secretion system C-terminal sorting domain